MAYGEILTYLFTALPSLVKAVQEIMNSNAAHTIETAVGELIQHNTKGQPNSQALTG